MSTSYVYNTAGVCARSISFELDDENCLHNVVFNGGCDGNLKMVAKFAEGMPADYIIAKCSGNLCRNKGTSCADQFAKGVQAALDNQKNLHGEK